MRMKGLAGLIMSLVVAVMAGCGGGGGGGAVTSGVALSGVATKGPVANGTVRVYQIISSATLNPRANVPRLDDTPLAQGETQADGSYNLTLPAGFTKGSLMIRITGGSYTDESTGTTKSLDDQYGPGGMRAVFTNISGMVRRGEALSASVTPYTELAYRDAAGHDLTDDGVKSSNHKVASAFGLPDIVKTKPLDPNKSFPLLAGDDAKKYALALATISQYQKDYGAGASMANLATSLMTELSGSGLSAETLNRMGASSNNYVGSSRNQNAELESPEHNPLAPKAIHTSPSSPLSVSIGDTVPLTAHVVKADGNVVPDGTLVYFATNFGTLSATSAATVNGFANVTLTSALVGTAQVSATSGSASDAIAPITFVNPNAPASMTLTANASQGVTVGPPVVLSAGVVRAAGGPVPDGTPVSFVVTSGTGTLSSATTTAGGVATVNLASSVANASVTVTATAGSVSKAITIPFIAQPTQAIVKLRSTGTLPSGTLIGGIGATVNYATGKGLGIASGDVVLSGVGAGSSMIPNTTTAGQVVVGLINVNGIAVGEFVTLTFSIAAGNFPTASDFSIASGANAIDVNTATIPGIGVAIASVTIQ